MTTYRGNYPDRIESIWSVDGLRLVRLNCGAVFSVAPINGKGPEVSSELSAWTHGGDAMFTFEYQSDKRSSVKPSALTARSIAAMGAELAAASQGAWNKRNADAKAAVDARLKADAKARREAPRVSFIVKQCETTEGAGLAWSVSDILEPKRQFTGRIFRSAVKRCKADAKANPNLRFWIELRQGRAGGRFLCQIDPLAERSSVASTVAQCFELAALARGQAAHYGAMHKATGAATYKGVADACKSSARYSIERARTARLSGQAA